MTLRTLTAIAALASAAAALPASAATITLTMNSKVDESIELLGNVGGTEAFGTYFPAPKVQVFEATVLDDAGVPIANACLANGARIELVDGSLNVRGGASCTNSSGKWQFVLTDSRFTRPGELTAQLLTPATTLDGRLVSPASSNVVVLAMAARITNTSPVDVTGKSFPITGYITMPAKLRAQGTVRLEKQVAGKWNLLGAKRTDSSGKFKFTISYGTKGKTGTFRLRFVPPKSSGWVTSSDRFTITWS